MTSSRPWDLPNPCRTPPMPPIATSHTTNHTGTVAVATDRYWLPITPDTPRGVKLHLLNNTGAGTIGHLTEANIRHFCGWEPMAKIPPGMLDGSAHYPGATT